jgi:hypothetical protein
VPRRAAALQRRRSAADAVQFADGTCFPRDMLLTTSVDQPYRLDVLCFLAQFASRYPGACERRRLPQGASFANAWLQDELTRAFMPHLRARRRLEALVWQQWRSLTGRAVLAFLTTEGEASLRQTSAPRCRRHRSASRGTRR